MTDTLKLTTPQRHVLAQMRAGAVLRSRELAGISPWLEVPDRAAQHVSQRTMDGLVKRGLIEEKGTAPYNTISNWHLTPAGWEAL